MFYFPVVKFASITSFVFQFNKNDAQIPATNPQKADPIPNKVKPDAEINMVIIAGSRSLSFSKEVLRLEAIVLNNAMPATAMISSFGNEKNSETTVAPNIPIVSQQNPANKVDLYRKFGLGSASLPVQIAAVIAARHIE